jgi:hypothetical protein
MKLVNRYFIIIIVITFNLGLYSCQKQVNYASDISGLLSQIADLKKTTDSLTFAVGNTNKQISITNSKIDSIIIKINLLSTQINDLSLRATQANANIDEINKKIIDLQRQIDILKNEIESLKSVVFSINTGLILYFPFSGNNNDSSGNKLSIISNSGTFTNDKNNNSNSAILLNGVNQMIAIKGTSKLATDTFSVSFWTYAYTYNIHNKVQYGETSSSLRWSLNWGTTRTSYSPMTCTGAYGSASNIIESGIQTGIWVNLIYVIEGTNTKFYKDGQYIGSSNTADKLVCFKESMNLYFGGDIGGGLIEYYNGKFDEIRIYNRVLNNSEIYYLSKL